MKSFITHSNNSLKSREFFAPVTYGEVFLLIATSTLNLLIFTWNFLIDRLSSYSSIWHSTLIKAKEDFNINRPTRKVCLLSQMSVPSVGLEPGGSDGHFTVSVLLRTVTLLRSLSGDQYSVFSLNIFPCSQFDHCPTRILSVHLLHQYIKIS